MEDKVVNFKVAKLAKEKGFSNGTSRRLTHYKEESNHPEDGTKGPFGWEKNEIQIDDSFIVNGRRGLGDLSNEFYDCYELPTLSLLQMWLIRKKGLFVYVSPYMNKNPDGELKVTLFRLPDSFRLKSYDGFKEYEQALEKGLYEALKLIKL